MVTLECRAPEGCVLLGALGGVHAAKLDPLTCTRRRSATEPLRVDLVSVVHVGDEAYYSALQTQLSTYDRVLYELIVNIPKEPGSPRWRPPPPARRRTFRNPVAFAQRFIGSVLQLELQLEHLDYSHEHWYHADLELVLFLQLQRKRDESWPKLLWRALQAEVAREVANSDAKDGDGAPTWKRLLRWSQDRLPLPMVIQLVVAGALEQAEDRPLSRSPVVGTFLNLDIPSGLKLVLAEQLASDSVFTSGVLRSSVLVAERNIAAVAAVRAAKHAGARRVAVLYGSAHMPDMERRLLDELGMQRVATAWADAWRVPLPCVEPSVLRLQRRQAAALGAFSLLLATDLSLWEQLLQWAGENLAVGGLWVVQHLPL